VDHDFREHLHPMFFFGFHFGQFKQLKADVHAIRVSVEKIEQQTNENSMDIAIIKDRAS